MHTLYATPHTYILIKNKTQCNIQQKYYLKIQKPFCIGSLCSQLSQPHTHSADSKVCMCLSMPARVQGVKHLSEPAEWAAFNSWSVSSQKPFHPRGGTATLSSLTSCLVEQEAGSRELGSAGILLCLRWDVHPQKPRVCSHARTEAN